VSKSNDGKFNLRWFTPTNEVPLCGHATLAAAKALLASGMAKVNEPLVFVTRYSGELRCTFIGDEIAMDFPATPLAPCPPPVPEEEMRRVLGVEGPITCVGFTKMCLTLRLPNAKQVQACKPDMAALATWFPIGVCITAGADAEIAPNADFVSRFFAPAFGIPEDPVTGSAHCALAPYWAAELGKTTLVARQLSRRGGELKLQLLGDRVELRGSATIVMNGTLDLPPES